jgi:iron(III) transport system permease protein
MSAWATGLGVVVGTVSSYVIIKTKLRIKWLIEILVMLPWALPASTVAINIINAYNQPNIFVFNRILVGTYWILPITYFIGLLPLVVRATNASLLQMHASLEEASRSLGASWGRTFLKIVVPIVAPGIVAGALLGFVSGLGDYTTSALMYTIVNKPISIAMTNALYNFEVGLAMAYGVVQIFLTATFIVITRKLGKAGEFRF